MANKITVDIFIPCFIDQMYPETGFNMVKVLEKAGCQVNYNPNQTCCGQPSYNAGFFEEAKEVAEKFVSDFQNEDRYIVTPSASCAGMVRNGYETLLAGRITDPKVRSVRENVYEFSEFLVDVLGVESIPGATFEAKMTYHDSCSALRECHIKEAPRKLLSNVKGLELQEMADTKDCCGFGGTFSVKFEPISVGMAEQKVENALATNAEYIVSTDASCLMHLDAYIKKKNLPIKTVHIADVLATGW
jgi:L-lactate dehydrogenase complex protein LldE